MTAFTSSDIHRLTGLGLEYLMDIDGLYIIAVFYNGMLVGMVST